MPIKKKAAKKKAPAKKRAKKAAPKKRVKKTAKKRAVKKAKASKKTKAQIDKPKIVHFEFAGREAAVQRGAGSFQIAGYTISRAQINHLYEVMNNL